MSDKFTKISVLVPTRMRLKQLELFILSYLETTRGAETSSELVFRVDEDDKESQRFIQATDYQVLIGPRYRGYESLPQFFNELTHVATGDVFMLGNDDVRFVTPGWAPKILTRANTFPDGLFNIGVKTHNESHFPLSIVSRKAVNRLGFIYDPRIFWGDIFLRDVMSRLGRNVMLPEVEIQHVWAGFDPDKTFIEGEGARRSNWMTHHVQAVDEAESKLKGLLAA